MSGCIEKVCIIKEYHLYWSLMFQVVLIVTIIDMSAAATQWP